MLNGAMALVRRDRNLESHFRLRGVNIVQRCILRCHGSSGSHHKSSKSLKMNAPAGIASPYRQGVQNRLSTSNTSALCQREHSHRRLSTPGYHNFILATSKDTIVDNASAPGIQIIRRRGNNWANTARPAKESRGTSLTTYTCNNSSSFIRTRVIYSL